MPSYLEETAWREVCPFVIVKMTKNPSKSEAPVTKAAHVKGVCIAQPLLKGFSTSAALRMTPPLGLWGCWYLLGKHQQHQP